MTYDEELEKELLNWIFVRDIAPVTNYVVIRSSGILNDLSRGDNGTDCRPSPD